MKLNPGCEVEYEKRHRAIWPELVKLLKETGVSDYYIFWDKETNLLFSIVRNLKAKGTSVLYVTHRLEEIMELTDRVTVLRNGTLVSTVDTAGTSRKELVRR